MRSNLPVPDIYEGDEADGTRRHYFDLDSVAVERATLEQELAELVAQLSGGYGVGPNFVELAANSRELDDALESSAWAEGEPSPEVHRFLERYKYFRDQRNIAARSALVSVGPNSGGLDLAMFNPKSNGVFRLPTLGDVNALLQEIGDLTTESYHLKMAVVKRRIKERKARRR